MGKHIIIGAGKIGRGFIAQLLYRRGEEFCFIEKSPELGKMLNEAGYYHVHVLGDPAKDSTIRGIPVLGYDQTERIREKVGEADVIYTCVGGKNLHEVAGLLAVAIRSRLESGNTQVFNVITCENWQQPAELLRNSIREEMKGLEKEFEERVGFAESVILRSGIECPGDPLAVNAQDYWKLPVNAAKIKGKLPELPEFELMNDFDGFLERKFYTYNAANGTVSYMGTLMGYQHICEAAHDPWILKNLHGVYEETSLALCHKQQFPLEKQYEFVGTSLAKLQNETLVDTLERNARDPIRKLSPSDRLLGPALMGYEYGIKPEHLCLSIAAAIYYESPSAEDESAARLKAMRREGGPKRVLQDVCGLDQSHELFGMILRQVEVLREKGLIQDGE